MANHPEAPARLPGGVSVGHWTDTAGRTGCTVVLVPGGAVPGVDVRGGAPGTLGTDELRPGMTRRAGARHPADRRQRVRPGGGRWRHALPR